MALQRGFKVDLRRCIGCHACVVACLNENNLDPYHHWRDVMHREWGTYPDVDRVHVSMACFHCKDPACMPACPVSGAITKDPADGAVLIDQDLCNGCRRCVAACPYEAPRFNSLTNKVDKCTFCKHRVGDSNSPTHLPACVSTCPTGALGYLENPTVPTAAQVAPGFADPKHTHPSVEFVLGTTPAGGVEVRSAVAG